MSAASAARRVDPAREVVVVEASAYAAWGVCGLPYFAAGLVPEPTELVSHPPSFFRDERGIDLRLDTRVIGLDPTAASVTIEDSGGRSTIEYDSLVLATGASPVLPPIPGLGFDHVYTVRSLEGAIALRARLETPRVGRCLVVGAGYVGLEMVEALAAQGCRVTVAERLPQVMTNLDPEIAGLVEATIRQHADLRLGFGLASISQSDDALVATLEDGDALEVDVVVVACGIKPASQLLTVAGAQATDEGALIVDNEMRTSLPGVFAAGDCIAAFHRVLGRPAYVPLGPTANKTGHVAGTVAAGGKAHFAGVVGTAVVKVFDLCVARTGLTLREARDAGLEATASDSSALSRAKYYPGTTPTYTRLVHQPDGRILGAQMVSLDPSTAKRIDVLAAALHAGFDVATLGDLDLSYAPPYAPVYDPILRAAQASQKRLAAVG